MSFGDVESGGSGRRGMSSWGSSPFSTPSTNVDEEFNTLAKQVQTDIQQMASSIRVLRSSSQIVGTPRDTDDLRNQIRDTLHSAQSTARQLGTDIKKLLRLAGESGSHDLQTKRRRLAEKLKDDFEGQLREFREVGRSAAEKEKQALQTKQRTGAGPRGGFGETTALLSSPQPTEEQRLQQFSLMQLDADVTFNENAAQGLEAEIKELETAVLELNDIFKDLSTLVYDQSVTIDSIEQHVESAVMYTDEGVIELNEARSLQSRSRMWICCVGLLVCLLVTGAIIGIVLGVTLGGNSNDNKSSKSTAATTTTLATTAAAALS